MTNISQELLHIGFCNLIQVLWIISCFMGKRTRFLLLILPLISSFFFLSNFQIFKKFHLFFSGTERDTKLKLDTHIWAKCWSIVYTKNKQQNILVPLFFFFFSVSLISKDEKTCFYKLFQHTCDGYCQGYVSFAHSLLYFFKHAYATIQWG